MIEYNERAAVSRLLIPAILNEWKQTDPQRHDTWTEGMVSFNNGALASLDILDRLLMTLPERLSIETLRIKYRDAFLQFEQSFPALLNEPTRWPLPVRTRALHHLGEVRRVALAQSTLESIQAGSSPESRLEAMRRIGQLINESHASLRDLYTVSTSEVEQIMQMLAPTRTCSAHV